MTSHEVVARRVEHIIESPGFGLEEERSPCRIRQQTCMPTLTYSLLQPRCEIRAGRIHLVPACIAAQTPEKCSDFRFPYAKSPGFLSPKQTERMLTAVDTILVGFKNRPLPGYASGECNDINGRPRIFTCFRKGIETCFRHGPRIPQSDSAPPSQPDPLMCRVIRLLGNTLVGNDCDVALSILQPCKRYL